MESEIKNFQARLIQYLLKVLNGQSRSFIDILARSQNCDPAFLVDVLREMEARGLIHVSRETPPEEYALARNAGTSDCIRPVLPAVEQPASSDHRNVVGSNYFNELVDAVLRSLPEPSLVYSQWWFSKPAYAKFTDLLLGFHERECHTAFLGSARLGAVFSQCVASPVTIVDVDGALLQKVRTCAGESVDFIHRDISTPLDKPLRSRFDVVVADPPWSSSNLRTFFVRSAEMLAPGGTLVISFPPVFTRPSAQAERKGLLRVAEFLGLSFTTERTGFTEYSVPSFEYRAYKEHGIELHRPWRKGDILVFKKRDKVAKHTDVTVDTCCTWNQYDYGVTRLFLKRNGAPEEGPARVIPISGRNNFAYDSTSSRTQLWKQAGLVSTRN